MFNNILICFNHIILCYVVVLFKPAIFHSKYAQDILPIGK